MNMKNRIIKASIINALCISLIFGIFIPGNAQNLNIDNNEVQKKDVDTTNQLPTAGVTNIIYDSISNELGNSAEVAITNIPVSTSSYEDIDVEIVEEVVVDEEEPLYIEVSEYQMYINCYSGLRVRSTPDTKQDNVITVLPVRTLVTIIGESDGWAVINFNDQIAYICKDYLQESDPEYDTYNYNWSGEVLNNANGKVYGPSGYETYYNLPMYGCVRIMNNLGYYGTVWTRSDGVKMWDQYVMVAADLSIHPKGSLVETTLGTGIVVDTGGFITNGSGVSLDIAVAW